ncbi:DUF4271 domain-containing protein [Dokdonia sinensis]|uniref:DUF4271 domain-containing protein n=1 Tax=Dokdonia sinensis TaxID=2479847 RepID=A0A3M0G0M8_9FLAO|nr:DUF4271 domain-containing protein [Dokdonia sinensis]RMB58531.1 DUF4271 domain-containing protein [Dokdonia sinensis]
MIIVSCFVVLALAKYFYNERFLDFITVLQNDRYLNTGLRKTSNWHPFNILVTLVQVCTVSLTIFLIYSYLNNKIPSEQPFIFLQLLLGYIILLFSKGILEYVVTYFLGLKELFESYHFKKITYRNLLSIALLVCCCFFIFSKNPNNTLIFIILGISGVIILISSFNIASKYRGEILSHPFYFILYFCALEIAPYYILYKVIEP